MKTAPAIKEHPIKNSMVFFSNMLNKKKPFTIVRAFSNRHVVPNSKMTLFVLQNTKADILKKVSSVCVYAKVSSIMFHRRNKS